MTKDELFDTLDGMFAYDAGCTDSGIKNEPLRRQIFKHMAALPTGVQLQIVSAFLTKEYTPEQGYGVEEWVDFLVWYQNQCLFTES